MTSLSLTKEGDNSTNKAIPPGTLTLYQKKGNGYGYRPERLSLWTTSPTRRDILEAKKALKTLLRLKSQFRKVP